GPPYFNLVVGLLISPLLLVLPIGPLAAWKRADLPVVLSKLWLAAIIAFAVIAATFALTSGARIEPVLIMGAGSWIFIGAAADLLDRSAFLRADLAVSFKRLMGLPRSAFGTACAHAGFGVVLCGVAAAGAFQLETLAALKVGDALDLGRFHITLASVSPTQGANYTADRATFRILSRSDNTTIISERRRYWTRRVDTTKVGLLQRGPSEIYIALGDKRTLPGGASAYSVHAYYHPLVLLIWAGALMMALGGALALSDRRLRLAILGKQIAPVAAAQTQPAE
ncbi:MAG TPA: cytochrome c-type biogenesis CcmF C-terminal domain-containing protein, partial [Alphaproteobacteria bacterium]|nr:cytochrome c-type biogenesis CcmF C-terminal domain-containing protein [Alphaproteobacteria bacterium]